MLEYTRRITTKGIAGVLSTGVVRALGRPYNLSLLARAIRGAGSMAIGKPLRRLPLRDLLTDAEKRARDLIEQLHVTFLARAADLRELSRPVRKRSHFPAVHALLNALQKVVATGQETEDLIAFLMQELEEIHSHAKREQERRA